MLANTRSRTVFTLRHKYSSDALEEPAGEAAATAASAAATIVKKKVSIRDGRATQGGVLGRELLRSALSEPASPSSSPSNSALGMARPVTAPACDRQHDADAMVFPGSPPGRLAGNSHLAGTLSGAGLRKDSTLRLRPAGLTLRPGTSAGVLLGNTGSSMLLGAPAEAAEEEQEMPLAPASPGGAELCFCSSFVPIRGPVSPAAAGGALLKAALSPGGLTGAFLVPETAAA